MCLSVLDIIYVYIVYILGNETTCLDCSRARIIQQQWFCFILRVYSEMCTGKKTGQTCLPSKVQKC